MNQHRLHLRASRSVAAAVLSLGLIAAGGCAGNRTTQAPGEYIDDSAITASVRTALIGESGVNSTDINIETFRGIVQLSGFVNNQTQIDRAIAVAKAQGGVKSVKNDLRIKPAN